MTFEGATNLSIAPEYCMISTLYWVRPQPLTYMVEIVWILESKKIILDLFLVQFLAQAVSKHCIKTE